MSRRQPLRLLGLCLSGLLVVTACGASESGDRDRNVDADRPEVFFSRAIDGVARNKVADVKMSLPTSITNRLQQDGSTLVAITSIASGKTGLSSEVAVVRIDTTGQFDETFGTNGVRTLKINRPLSSSASLSDDGHVVVPAIPLVNDAFEGMPLIGATRFDLATGEKDDSFGPDGFIDVTPMVTENENSVVDGGNGVYILGTSNEISTDGRFLMRWTKDGRDATFGGDGLVAIPKPEYPLESNQSLACHAPTVWPDANDTLAVVFGCVLLTTDTAGDEPKMAASRRMIVTRQFTNDGSPVGDAERFVFLDEPNSDITVSHGPEITGLAVGLGADSASRYVSVNTYPGPQVIKLTDDYTKIVDSGLPQDGALPELTMGAGNAEPTSMTYPQYVHGTEPRVVGLVLNSVAASLDVLVGAFPTGGFFSAGNTLRVGDYPLVTHGFENLSYVGNDVFLNIAAQTGSEILPFGDRVNGLDGYLKIARDGITLEPYGSADGMAESPLNDGFGVDKNVVVQPGLFPAVDGSMAGLAVERGWLTADAEFPAATFYVQRYDATGEKSGAPIAIPVERFNTIFGQSRVTAAFDGTDSFYVTGFRGVDFGVAKLSITDKSIDESFGNKGFAAVPTNGEGFIDPWWFSSSIQLGQNGTVDLISSSWSWTKNESGETPLQVASLRFSASGELDESAPPMRIRLDNIVACDCLFDGWLSSISDSATVDAAGRLLIAFPKMEWEGDAIDFSEFMSTSVRTPVEGEGLEQFMGGGEVRRYLRNGDLDTTFGVEGSGGVDLYEMGVPFPLDPPRIALDPQGNIFMTINALEIRMTGLGGESEVDFIVDGEYSYAVMLDSLGKPINFTPREPLAVSAPIIDALRESRAKLGLGEPVAAPTPSTGDATSNAPVAAIATAPGTSASNVIPAGVIEINNGNVPVISVIGTPADRTIDVRWSIPAELAGGKATYTVTASPGNQKCTTSTTSCVFKKLEPWTAYTFTIQTVRAASTAVADSAPSVPVKPVRIVKRKSRTAATKLVTPASKGKATWKATGGCAVTKDGKTFTAAKDAGVCTLSVTTAKSGKTPKTTRTITVVVRAVAS